MADADARLTEIALAHQERQGEELSEVVRAQVARLDALERRLARLTARLAEIEADGAAPPAPDARPPHW
jgi:uncharacterized coiled-coil protein SlyX